MFERQDHPRLFALQPGVDFPEAVIAGLRARLHGLPPHEMAQVTLVVNTRRMANRMKACFDAGPAGFHPRLRLVTQVAFEDPAQDFPEAVSPLRRRLELAGLVSGLLDQAPDLAPRAALFDLADSLATLMDEMQGEGVTPDEIAALDVSDASGHWQRAQRFLSIVTEYVAAAQDGSDTEARQRAAIEALVARWRDRPPTGPVIVAGSTGSRGTTALLIEAVARLPQGAVILPGFDTDMPKDVWDTLADALSGEDHPQFRYARLMRALDMRAAQVLHWTDVAARAGARNRLVSLALRPAPVTDQWLIEGPDLPALGAATQEVTLLEAPSGRDEAMAIAMRLRQAAETGQSAALVTPDRMLGRQVTAALDRWGIRPDDSAGRPAHLTPPGRFLRHVAALGTGPLTAEALLTLLKHPLCHTGGERSDHLRHTRDLELAIRRKGWPYPQAERLLAWGEEAKCPDWTRWVVACFCASSDPAPQSLGARVDAHLALAERIAAGSTPVHDSGLWQKTAGEIVRAAMDGLQREAPHGGPMGARDYADLVDALLSREEVRDGEAAHPLIRIWGTLEVRAMGVDLMILGGLNEGSWPEVPAADPWLNRRMRDAAGLLLPERRIGLAAHDFQQAVAAPEVWLTRAAKTDDAQTVPSRWVNRLMNLMRGLPGQGGPEALEAMQARGRHWLALARALDAPASVPAAPRPSPAPPAEARPRRLWVTEIKRLIRDPYAIYAKHVLRLRPLDPLQRAPDALARGIVLHDALERFVRETRADPALLTAEDMLRVTRDEIWTQIPWPAFRPLWQARAARVAEWFVASEVARQDGTVTAGTEIEGGAVLPALGFELRGKADRIDLDDAGRALVYDYKSGAAPSERTQKAFDKQLLLEAAMLTRGGFDKLGPREVARAVYIALNDPPAEVDAPLEEMPPERTWAEFEALIASYLDADTGYTARRAPFTDRDAFDYDQLARFGEWDGTAVPQKQVLE